MIYEVLTRYAFRGSAHSHFFCDKKPNDGLQRIYDKIKTLFPFLVRETI